MTEEINNTTALSIELAKNIRAILNEVIDITSGIEDYSDNVIDIADRANTIFEKYSIGFKGYDIDKESDLVKYVIETRP